MKFKKVARVVLPIAIVIAGIGINRAIVATASPPENELTADIVPTVSVESVIASDYQLLLSAHGAVEPIEITQLSAKVSGEVVSWHESFVEGGVIKSGERLFSIDKDVYEAAVLQAEANLISANAGLIEEEAMADVARDEAKRNPNKKYTDLFLRKPQLLSAKASVKSAEAQLKAAKKDLANCEVYAPFDSLVVARDIGVGQFLVAGTSIAVLYNIESAKIVAPIAGFDSAFLPEDLSGVEVTVSDQSLNGVTRQGFIKHDLGVIDEDTRMSSLVIEVTDPYGIQNSEPALKFGSYANITFPGKTLHQVYRLPQELVNNRTVWVVNESSQLESRKVQVIREQGEFFFIGSGLFDDDRVVITPPEYPQRGMSVKIQPKDKDEVGAQVSTSNVR